MSPAGRLLWILVMIGCSCGTSTAGSAAAPAGLTSKVVEVRGGADLPEFLLTEGQEQGLPYFSAHKPESRQHKEKIVGFNRSAELAVKRTRRYVIPDGYEGTEGNTLAEAMKLPEERGGLKLSRWVVCSWVISNISAAEALKARNIPFLDNIPELLRTVQNLSPSQVYAVAAANITIGFTFTGVNSSSLTPAAEDAFEEAASDLAGGYSKSLISVSTKPPAAGTSSQMEGRVQVQDAPGVVKRGKDLGQPAPAVGTASGRRLQQGALTGPRSQHRRLLQSAAAAALAAPAASTNSSSGSEELSVWLLYKHVAPANTSALLTELCVSCNITPTAAVGTELTDTPCGLEYREALEGAGVAVNDATYTHTLSAPPTVSLSVRLAIGMTPAQVAAGDDVALAQWLAQPETTQAMARMYAPDAVVSWLHSPEVWYQKVAAPPPALSPGAAAGVAVGGMAALCGIVGLAVWLMHRRAKQSSPADKDDGASSQGSGRRRRRQGKRRYLLPEAARPGPQSQTDQAGPSSSAEAAAAGGSQEGSSGGDDDDLSPDQIRPQLRSLGDSVTSAVRFEQSDEEEGDGEAHEEHADDAAGASTSHAAAGAAGAAAAGAAAAAAAAGTSGSRSAPDASSSTPASSRSVLAARAAVLAEYQQAANQRGAPGGAGPSGLAGCSSSSSRTAQVCQGGRGSAVLQVHSAASPLPGAVSPELAAAAEMSSAVGTSAHTMAFNQPGATSASTQATTAAAGGSVLGFTRQAPALLKPVDERAAAASAAAVAAAATLPQAGAVVPPTSRRASPFAMNYNFEGLADTHPAAAAAAAGAAVSLPGSADPAAAAAAMAAASVGAVALPPRHVPLSPVCSPRSSQGAQRAGPAAAGSSNETLSPGAAAAAAGGALATSSSSSDSSTISGRQQQQGALRSRSDMSPSSSGGLPSSPLDSSSCSRGVGLQQLVSITPLRIDEGAAAAAAAAATITCDAPACTLGFQPQPEKLFCHSHSECTSVLPTDSYQSTLQLSSSMSGPMLQPCSTNCVDPPSHRKSCDGQGPDSSSVGVVGVRR